MDIVEMTTEEIAFLKSLYLSEKAIKEEKLYSYQKRTLEQYRVGKRYLCKKYPDYQFQILSCTPQTVLNPYASFVFKEQSCEKVFSMHIYEDQKRQYYAEDNFYGVLFAEKYDSYLQDVLGDDINGLLNISTAFRVMKGKEYNQFMTLEQVLTNELEVSPVISICINGNYVQDYMKEIQNIKMKISALEVYSFVIVYVLNEDGIEKYADISKIPKSVIRYKESFENFAN